MDTLRLLGSLGAVNHSALTKDGVVDLEATTRNSLAHIFEDLARHNTDKLYLYGVVQVRIDVESDQVGTIKLHKHPEIPNLTYIYYFVPNMGAGQQHWMTTLPYARLAPYVQGALLYETVAAPELYFNTYRSGVGRTIPLFTRVTGGFLDGYGCNNRYSNGDSIVSGFYNIFQQIYGLTEIQKEAMRDRLSQRVSFASLRNILNRITIIPHGVNIPELYELVEPEQGVVGWFGRGNQYKRIDYTFELYDKLFEMGVMKKCIATAQPTGIKTIPVKGKARNHYVNLHESGHNFMDIGKEARLVLANNRDIPFPATLIQAAAYGTVPVLPDKPWAVGLLDNAPIYNTKRAALAACKKLLTDDEFYTSTAKALREEVAEKYNVATQKAELAESLLDETERFYSTNPDVNCPLLKYTPEKALAKYSWLEDVVETIQSRKEWRGTDLIHKIRPLRNGQYGNKFSWAGVHRLMQYLNYRDNLQHTLPTYHLNGITDAHRRYRVP